MCKILNSEDAKLDKVRYYLERRNPEFKGKMAEVLCGYRLRRPRQQPSRSPATRWRLIVGNHSACISKETRARLADRPPAALNSHSRA